MLNLLTTQDFCPAVSSAQVLLSTSCLLYLLRVFCWKNCMQVKQGRRYRGSNSFLNSFPFNSLFYFSITLSPTVSRALRNLQHRLGCFSVFLIAVAQLGYFSSACCYLPICFQTFKMSRLFSPLLSALSLCL